MYKCESKCVGTETEFKNQCTQTSLEFISNIMTVEQLTCCTGINNFGLFDFACDSVEKYVQVHYKVTQAVLSIRDQVLLKLMKLKQNCPFTLLSVFFGVSRVTCSRYFKKHPNFTCYYATFIVTPTLEEVQDNMPFHCRNFPMCKYLLDCTEIPIIAPKCITCKHLSLIHI